MISKTVKMIRKTKRKRLLKNKSKYILMKMSFYKNSSLNQKKRIKRLPKCLFNIHEEFLTRRKTKRMKK